MQSLAKHGHFLPPNMQGLTEDQIEELKLHDEYEKISIPQGGSVECPDPIGRRSGKGWYPCLPVYCPLVFEDDRIYFLLAEFVFIAVKSFVVSQVVTRGVGNKAAQC